MGSNALNFRHAVRVDMRSGAKKKTTSKLRGSNSNFKYIKLRRGITDPWRHGFTAPSWRHRLQVVLITNAERGWIELNLGHGKITRKSWGNHEKNYEKTQFFVGNFMEFPKSCLEVQKKMVLSLRTWRLSTSYLNACWFIIYGNMRSDA